MYACMSVCMYVCTYVHIYISTKHQSRNICIYVFVYAELPCGLPPSPVSLVRWLAGLVFDWVIGWALMLKDIYIYMYLFIFCKDGNGICGSLAPSSGRGTTTPSILIGQASRCRGIATGCRVAAT